MQKIKHKTFLVLSIIVILITHLGCDQNKSNVPQIEISNEIYIGKVIINRNGNDKFEIEIPIKNISENNIRIRQIQTSCNCLISNTLNLGLILEPNESSILKLYYRPTELDIGYIERVVFVYFHGFSNPILITLKGTVSKE